MGSHRHTSFLTRLVIYLGGTMRLSRLADFAVVVMSHVAQNDCAGHNAAAVAEATRLPAPTAAKVLARMCREPLLVSMRGRKGGYAPARPAAATSVGSIVAALDGPVGLTSCVEPGAKRYCVRRSTRCRLPKSRR